MPRAIGANGICCHDRTRRYVQVRITYREKSGSEPGCQGDTSTGYWAVRKDVANPIRESAKMSHFDGSKLYQYGPFR